jgi:hypothetical protein
MTIDVHFIDSGREPQNKPDPKYPDGMDINLATSVIQKTCCRNLPYPAPRCGVYQIRCRTCDLVVAITVAGRPDDPRTVQLPCKAKGMN